ncbi:interleukin-21 isoform X2 [Pleuronectes platessa]|uniref:interleukin-21 isoform X2 n=1 Tax=Pleuronectes platessa TaxID=8262 RepID=UPI00232A5F20|nr:interleukin-21 isoform X2 [Pleuronectes platessa]
MKLAVLFLVAVCCCCSLGFAGSKERNKLEEVREHLKNLRTTLLQNKGTMLHSPPHDVEDCCYRSALQCFHSNLVVHFKATSKTQTKFNRSLRHPLTISGVKHCPPPNNTATICPSCDLQPKVSVEVFIDRLNSLIQKAISRLGSK